jgi:hypothetical protein
MKLKSRRLMVLLWLFLTGVVVYMVLQDLWPLLVTDLPMSDYLREAWTDLVLSGVMVIAYLGLIIDTVRRARRRLAESPVGIIHKKSISTVRVSRRSASGRARR